MRSLFPSLLVMSVMACTPGSGPAEAIPEAKLASVDAEHLPSISKTAMTVVVGSEVIVYRGSSSKPGELTELVRVDPSKAERHVIPGLQAPITALIAELGANPMVRSRITKLRGLDSTHMPGVDDVLVLVEPQTEMATVVDVLFNLGKAGARAYEFGVATPAGVRVLDLRPPMPCLEPPSRVPTCVRPSVLLASDGVFVSASFVELETGCKLRRADQPEWASTAWRGPDGACPTTREGLPALFSELAEFGPRICEVAVVSAEQDRTWAEFAGLLAWLQDTHDFVPLVIEAGSGAPRCGPMRAEP